MALSSNEGEEDASYMKTARICYYISVWESIKSFGRLLVPSPLRRGKSVKRLEERFQSELQLDNPILMPHARVCLYYILKSWDIKNGDEILMSAVNVPDMLNMIRIIGADIKFVDFKKNHYGDIDPDDLDKKISSKSKILFVAPLCGISPNMNDLVKLKEKYNLKLILDLSQCMGCSYQDSPLHYWPDASFYTLCALKTIDTHIGAVISTKDTKLVSSIRTFTERDFHTLSHKYLLLYIIEDFLSALAFNKKLFSLLFFPVFHFLEFSNPRLLRNLISGQGISFSIFGRLHITLFKGLFGGIDLVLRDKIPDGMLHHYSNWQAKIGLTQLNNFPCIHKTRAHNALLFLDNIPDVPENARPIIHDKSINTFWRLPIRVSNPQHFKRYLLKEGIDSDRGGLECLSEEKVFQIYEGRCPNTKHLIDKTINIPVHYYHKDREVLHIAKLVNNYFKLYE